MNKKIRILMMGDFNIHIDDIRSAEQLTKAKKGAALIQYLILHEDEPVTNTKLFEVLWPDEESSNPESALKTLISRVRSQMNKAAEGFGDCICSQRSAYQWKMQPNMTVDYYEVRELIRQLADVPALTDAVRADYDHLMSLYKGDLLQGNTAQCDWVVSYAMLLHDQYLQTIYHYIDLLKAQENFTAYDEVAQITRNVLEVDNFDERLHLELMNALTKTDRSIEALQQYKHVTNLHYRYLGIQPSEAIQDFYKQIMQARSDLAFNMESIRNELRDQDANRGAFVCEYTVFKEIYNLQIRNMERMGIPMFLGLVMITSTDGNPIAPLKLNQIMEGLLDILQKHLRKGDAITHFLPAQIALLLPSVNYEKGNMVLERIRSLFFKQYPNSNMIFHYRLGPLTGENDKKTDPKGGNGEQVTSSK